MNDEILQIEKLVNQGSYLQAEKIAWSLHKANPNNLQITKILGLVLLLQGNYLLAEKFYIEFMNKEPGDFDVNLNLAAIYARNEEYQLCEKFALQANNLNDQHSGSYIQLAELCIKTRQFEKAKKLTEKCIELKGGKQNLIETNVENVRLKILLSDIYQGLGLNDEAANFLKSLNDIDQTHPNFGENFGENIYRILDINHKIVSPEDVKILHSIIDKKYPDQKSNWKNKVGCLYSLGTFYEKAKEKERSEKYYDLANKMVLERQRFVPMGEQKNIIELFNNYVHPDILPFASDLSKGEGVIFVVGLPRSGTTLLESIFSTNENIESGGELLSMTQLCRSLIDQKAYKFDKKELQIHVDVLGDKYIKRIDYIRKEKKFFIDKLPGNYFNVAMIARILPAAKIINLKRNPWDVSISAYKRMYIQNVAYASNFFYMAIGAANYLCLTQNWEKDEKLTNFRTFHYEELVANPRDTSNTIFDFCKIIGGFDLKKRTNFLSRTASQNQIRQEIHKSSIEKKEFDHHKKEFESSMNQQLDFWQKKGLYSRLN